MWIAKNIGQTTQYAIVARTLHFKQPAGTSRGVYTTRQVHYVFLSYDNGERWGVGECAPLPQLSCDDLPDYAAKLTAIMEEFLHCGITNDKENGQVAFKLPKDLMEYPSIEFGLTTALTHSLMSGLPCTIDEIEDESVFSRVFPTDDWKAGPICPFTHEGAGIPINGLIWMGTYDEMHARIQEKLAQGFRCIKLKIGAIDFDRELSLLREIRQHYTPEQLELRVDANGAFTPDEAPEKLRLLAECGLHSIEQPIRAGQREALAELCKTSPLPIALDEELIGIHTNEEMDRLLDTVRPQYIVLKPSLVGGLGAGMWMKSARKHGVGYWITSALESNIGLNAIAQLCSFHGCIDMPQGLGTGLLFTDNVPVPLKIEGDKLFFRV